MSLHIGSHITISKTLPKAAEIALELGANTFQFFPRNPRGGAFRSIPLSEIEEWKVAREEHGIGPIIAHVPYTVNMASPAEKTREFAFEALSEDWLRCRRMGASYMVVHPGSYVRPNRERGLERIVESLNRVTAQVVDDLNTDDPSGIGVLLLLESMAGQGTEIGATPQELGAIIDQLDHPQLIGFCLDTCHVFASGYDIRTRQELDEYLQAVDNAFGLDRLKVVHLNDSMTECGSHKDRHQTLTEGELGREGVANIVQHPRLAGLPLILETPVDDFKDWIPEIELVKRMAGEEAHAAAE